MTTSLKAVYYLARIVYLTTAKQLQCNPVGQLAISVKLLPIKLLGFTTDWVQTINCEFCSRRFLSLVCPLSIKAATLVYIIFFQKAG